MSDGLVHADNLRKIAERERGKVQIGTWRHGLLSLRNVCAALQQPYMRVLWFATRTATAPSATYSIPPPHPQRSSHGILTFYLCDSQRRIHPAYLAPYSPRALPDTDRPEARGANRPLNLS